jgi:hypothetical protein
MEPDVDRAASVALQPSKPPQPADDIQGTAA